MSTQAPARESSLYDPARRVRAVRHGRERGCWVYIPAEELRRAGFVPGGDLPFYRRLGFQRSRNAGTVIVSLFRTK